MLHVTNFISNHPLFLFPDGTELAALSGTLHIISRVVCMDCVYLCKFFWFWPKQGLAPSNSLSLISVVSFDVRSRSCVWTISPPRNKKPSQHISHLNISLEFESLIFVKNILISDVLFYIQKLFFNP